MRAWLPSLLLFVPALAPVLSAQAVVGPDEAAVRWVDGRPMLRVTLRADDKVYFCHLLLDLATTAPLYLHRNAAGSLRAEACEVEIGGITLRDVPFTARRDTWLEGLTAQFAEELQQVPVAGILGLAAFGERDLVLDGPKERLRSLPPTGADVPSPPSSPAVTTLPMASDFARDGLRIAVDLGAAGSAKLTLHSRDPFGWLEPALCRKANAPHGVLPTAKASPELDFATYAPFRPLASPSGERGGIGGAVLRQLVLHIQPAARRVIVDLPAQVVYPEVEAAFYRAFHAEDRKAALRTFVQEHADSPFGREAAETLFAVLVESGGDAAALQDAGLLRVQTAAAKARATTAIDVLKHVPDGTQFAAARQAIAEAGMAFAREDEDGTAGFQLRLELGRLLRAAGDVAGARRHLLAAVFGMPTSGAANLELGAWHEQQGQLEAALGRYFLAMLDAKNTGEPGFDGFARLLPKARPQADLLTTLSDMADGRVPALEPIARDPATVKKTGRTVLAELFTGAQCPPCVAADVAADALTGYYDRDELVLIQWHLPVPAPEPLVSPAALARAEQRAVRSTPTLVLGAAEPIVGGGKADAATEVFGRYRELAQAELGKAPVATVGGEATLSGDQLNVSATVAATTGELPVGWRLFAVLTEDLLAYPGKNGVLFHHHVARAWLTSATGVAAQDVAGKTWTRQASLGAITAALAAQVAEYETEQPFLVRPTTPDPRRLRIVAWVEDASGTVLQCREVPVMAAGEEPK
ncbi:MAG: hypothetical protein IPK26_22470 [Planctomycetes bacterium]|nr:hypothetical protein [Planctomycetota bacterium]